MRLPILSAFAALLLAACGQGEPESSAVAEAPVVIPQPPRIPDPEPTIALRPMDALPTDTEQARAQAEAERQALDRRAAELPGEIAGSRQQAEDAFRAARSPDPAPAPAPASAPAPTAQPAARATPAAPTAPAGTSPPPDLDPSPGN